MKLLKIRSLDKGWHDRDHVLLHGAFQILTDFIECEHPDRIIDWSRDKSHKSAWKEIRSLYKWWKKTRPSRKSPLDNKKLPRPPLKFKHIHASRLSERIEPDAKKHSKYFKALKQDMRLEKKWHEEDQKNLRRLIEIRPFLWT